MHNDKQRYINAIAHCKKRQIAVFFKNIFARLLTLRSFSDIMIKSHRENDKKLISFAANGGMAQLARATGSYPVGRKFKSYCRHHIRPVGQEVKTTPFHGVIMSSILVRVTKSEHFTVFGFFILIPDYKV